jgi:hypothetical protein
MLPTFCHRSTERVIWAPVSWDSAAWFAEAKTDVVGRHMRRDHRTVLDPRRSTTARHDYSLVERS